VTLPCRYVYGIVASGTHDWRLDTGVGDATLETIERDALAALASPLPTGEVRASRRNLYAHLRALECAFAATPIIPLPFGTVFDSVDAVREQLLGARQAELSELLQRIGGLAQFTLTAAYDEERVLREIVTGDERHLKLREQSRGPSEAGYAARLRLGELVAASLELVRDRDADALAVRLASLVEEFEAVDRRLDQVLRAELLVLRSKIDEFEDAVARLADEAAGRILFELVGPLPPTAFIERLRAVEAPAWA
jgi:hypothetical protein